MESFGHNSRRIQQDFKDKPLPIEGKAYYTCLITQQAMRESAKMSCGHKFEKSLILRVVQREGRCPNAEKRYT